MFKYLPPGRVPEVKQVFLRSWLEVLDVFLEKPVLPVTMPTRARDVIVRRINFHIAIERQA